MYERILVPLDGSELAEQALPYAREMATKFRSRLTLLRAITTSQEAFREVAAEPIAVTAPEMTVGVARNLYESEADEAREYLRRIATSFDGSGIEVETEMVEGDPEWVIEHQAKEIGASLIVMASHSRSGLARLLHGSVSDEIARASTVPLLLIRPAETPKDQHDEHR
jgi:nucleotide-binding universal stress UspA family protein